jgi:hypothetical protein
MKSQYIILCPFLKGSHEGVYCGVYGKLVKDIPEGNAKLCMSSHYEICSVYVTLLYREICHDCRAS